MKIKKHIIIITIIIVFVGTVVFAFAAPENRQQANAAATTAQTQEPTPTTADGEPFYKLQENVRHMFRPDWVWDESKKDYSNLGDLKRDPETGLFPEPSNSPQDLAGYAHWDPYLGLYIINSIQIDHTTGTITDIQPETTDESSKTWLTYDTNVDDKFNNAYWKYFYYTRDKYYNGGRSSAIMSDIIIMRQDKLTPEWFGLTLSDLKMVVDKLEAGAPTAYTMAIIMIMTDTDVGLTPSAGAPERYAEWVNAFNSMKSLTAEKVKARDFKGLGYLALPEIYAELKSGKGDDLVSILPEITSGLEGIDKNAVSSWDKEKWIAWFEKNTETLDTLQWMIDHEINMPWLKQ